MTETEKKSITDAQLIEVANFRTRARLPTVIWRNPRSGATLSRCSQPQVGLFGLSRCKSDEALIKAIHMANPSQLSKPLFLVDSRPTTNAKANHFLGAGHESEAIYQNCRLIFLEIDNIHVVRAAFNKIFDVFSSTDGLFRTLPPSSSLATCLVASMSKSADDMIWNGMRCDVLRFEMVQERR